MYSNKPILLIIFLLIFTSAQSQSIGEFVSSYTGENGNGYFQPLTNTLGATINSGLYNHTIPIATNKKWQFNFGIVSMNGLVFNNYRYFDAKTSEYFIPEITKRAPTVFGDGNPITVLGVSGTKYSFPGGMNTRVLPLVIPQLTISSEYGIDVVLRTLFAKFSDELGWLNILGGGIRWDINQKLDSDDFKFLTGLYIQSYDVGDVIDINTFLINGQVFYPKDNYEFYGGIGFEYADMNLVYTFESDYGDENISINTDPYTFVKLTVGTSYDFKKTRIFTEFNFGKQIVWAAGAMYIF